MCLTGETECQPGECPCKIKEVLRLRFELQLGQREIARACSISQGAVHNYLKKAAAAGIGWPLPEDWDEKRIEETLFGDRHPIERRQRALPDFPALHEQFQQHRHLTLQLAWEEYRQVHPDGYGYSRFCELYGRWLQKQDVVLRQNHTPGEKGLVDWAGRTIPLLSSITLAVPVRHAGTAKLRLSRTRQRTLWVGLWVGKMPSSYGTGGLSFSRQLL